MRNIVVFFLAVKFWWLQDEMALIVITLFCIAKHSVIICILQFQKGHNLLWLLLLLKRKCVNV